MNVVIKSEVPQNDGRKAVQAEFTTSLNDVVTKNFLIDVNLNPLDYATNKSADVIEQLKQIEMSQLESAINLGSATVETIVQGLRYLSINESLYSVVGRGITLTSVYRLINLKAIVDYTKANFTNTELATATGFDVALIELYYSRVATALTCKTALNSLAGSVING